VKGGRTHLAHKAEAAVDLETGAIRRRHRAGCGRGRHDTMTIVDTDRRIGTPKFRDT
jgi:hypothetical protein